MKRKHLTVEQIIGMRRLKSPTARAKIPGPLKGPLRKWMVL
jgi:hypothetical protein